MTNPIPPDSANGGSASSITAGLFGDGIIRQMADAALSSGQYDYLEALTPPVRELAWSWVMAAMRTAAHLQVESCFRAGISQAALERLVMYARMEVERRQHIIQLASQLVGAGATFMVVQALLPGISKADFSRLRQEQGLVGQPARKSIGDGESARIYRHWQALGNPVDAGGFLALHRESGQSLYVLWGLVQDWLHQTTRKGKG